MFSRLRIGFMPAHTSLKISCKGGGCRLKSYTAKISRDTRRLNLLTRLKKSRLRHGAVLELRVARPGLRGHGHALDDRAAAEADHAVPGAGREAAAALRLIR